MENSVLITIIIVSGIIVLAGIGFLIFNSLSPSNNINVNGQASVDVVPDLVNVYFNIETIGETSKEAKDKNAEILNTLTAALVNQGLKKEEIKTQSFNIYPNYEWDEGGREENGFKVSHSIVIELSTDDIDKVSGIIDAGADSGVGISHINFELSYELQNEYKAEAIKLASEDARIKAEAMAEGSGKKLGKLVSISDDSFGYSPWRVYDMAEDSIGVAKEVATSVQPAEQTISGSVRAIFKIK